MTEIFLLTLTVLLCLIGLALSSLAFSGTWVVLAAALITRFAAGFPNIGTLIAFALLCIVAEIFEMAAGFYGVTSKGGSRLSGLAAIIGGLIGASIGSAVFPILGTILGLLAGSFVLAFLVEWNRLKHHGQAARIAWGAVLARLAVLFFKTVLTLGMSIWLIAGLFGKSM